MEIATQKHLAFSKNFDSFFRKTVKELRKYAANLIREKNKWRPKPKPLLSIFIYPCIERGRDLADGGAKYNNSGMHGAGLSTAADALAAIKKTVFEEKSVAKKQLKLALKNDFVGYETLQKKLLACPKTGNNDDYVDDVAVALIKAFSSYVNGKPNGRGGI